MVWTGPPASRAACEAALVRRMDEKAPGRIQLFAGPRQTGKTTLLLGVSARFGEQAMYVAADGPEAGLPGFWERLWEEAEDLTQLQGCALVFIDEAHLLSDWSARLKSEWDRIRRRRLPIHIVATGSSSMRLAAGSRESLAGRFELLVMSHWSAVTLVDTFGLTPEDACDVVVTMGTYPGAIEYRGDKDRWMGYVRNAIVEPAIGRDIMSLAPVRKPALLRQVFGVCTSSPAQIVSLQKIQGQLQDRGALETVAQYLSLLEDAFLVAPIPKYASTPSRQRASPPKLITLNNALLAAMDPRGAPDRAAEPARFGAWVENACLAHAWNAGQRVFYWREEPLEVDAVIDGSWGSWAIEVKTGRVTSEDLKGLAEFTRRHKKYRPLVVCDAEGRVAAERARFPSMTWREFLLGGPA